ncbi:hypothetical protein CC80DRAFT_503567 [Byssothecium circinans]|uniref:Ig-like domain-containing protein n=1 Tax=Byssothecium circinans TaxID=147558 RepID=A0A6A5TZI2_9PLEO|nr:hypothetical protein CC80DRAFT_503567 [Byssothecium circinans]
MQFSAALVLFFAPIMALAGPIDPVAEPSNALRGKPSSSHQCSSIRELRLTPYSEKRAVPGCVVSSKLVSEWTEGGLARYRTEFTAQKIPSSDVCKVPYFQCMAMSKRRCWTRDDGVTIVDGSYAKGLSLSSYKGCLGASKQQWAKDNGCKCEGDYC